MFMSHETCIIKGCWLRSREAALLETQLNFARPCPGQTKDKIRLLIQKLEGRCVRPTVTPMLHKPN